MATGQLIGGIGSSIGSLASATQGVIGLFASKSQARTLRAQAQALRQRGQFLKQQRFFEASRLDFNSRLSELRAKDAITRGNKSANAFLRKAKMFRGAQRASLAAQGIEVDTGSASQVQQETEVLSKKDAEQIRNNAWREAYGHRVQAFDFRGQATLRRGQGRFEAITGQISGANTDVAAGNTLLTGAISSGGQFLQGLGNIDFNSFSGFSGGSSKPSSSPHPFEPQLIEL